MKDDQYNDMRAHILEVLAQINAEFIRARQPWVDRLLALEMTRPRSMLIPDGSVLLDWLPENVEADL